MAERGGGGYSPPKYATDFIPCGLYRLIALDKNLGVRPIGIGEVVKRINEKAVLSVVGGDIQQAAGALQLCAGQISTVEAAIHSMRSIFAEDSLGVRYLLMPVMPLTHLFIL